MIAPLPQILNNPLIGGGGILMAFGGLLALLRKLPRQIADKIWERFTVSLEIDNSDPAFDWFTIWLHNHPYSSKSRRLSVFTQKTYTEGDEVAWEWFLSPAPGNHFLRHGTQWIWLSRQKEENQAPGKAGDVRSLLKPETYRLTVLGRNRGVIRDLLAEVRALAEKKARYSVYISSYSSWRRLAGNVPRPLSSVILPGGMVEGLVEDIRSFFSQKDWYERNGIPYHRGYLLSGVPGSGKSSLVAALANAFSLNLYVLNLGSAGGDEELFGLIMNVPPRSMLLMEDIDITAPTRETRSDSEKKRVTLSGFLNCLDGVLSNTGIIVFMTTNHPEVLDTAILRPGRVDVHKKFGYLEKEQAAEMLRRFFPEQEVEGVAGELEATPYTTMADLQGLIQENQGDWEGLVYGAFVLSSRYKDA